MDSSEHSRKGAARTILIDGLVVKGGIFALAMLVGGYFIRNYFHALTVYDYMTAAETWVTFAYYFLSFGSIMGLFEYARAQRA